MTFDFIIPLMEVEPIAIAGRIREVARLRRAYGARRWRKLKGVAPMNTEQQPSFVVCVENTDYPASLELRKIYQVLPDEQAEQHSLMRVIDESGEDYLSPTRYFLSIELPQSVQQALALAA